MPDIYPKWNPKTGREEWRGKEFDITRTGQEDWFDWAAIAIVVVAGIGLYLVWAASSGTSGTTMGAEPLEAEPPAPF